MRPVRQPCAASVAQESTESMALCCCETWWSSTRLLCSASWRQCAAGRRMLGTWAGGAIRNDVSTGAGEGLWGGLREGISMRRNDLVKVIPLGTLVKVPKGTPE